MPICPLPHQGREASFAGVCSTCVTVFDTAATNAVIVAAFALNRWERLRDRLRGRSRTERRLATWMADADFLRSVGLDPLTNLGAPPAIPGSEDVEPVEPGPIPTGEAASRL